MTIILHRGNSEPGCLAILLIPGIATIASAEVLFISIRVMVENQAADTESLWLLSLGSVCGLLAFANVFIASRKVVIRVKNRAKKGDRRES
jgi:hypothetical protein